MLGAAGLQLAALRTNQQSSQLAFATALGAEMAEHIRANGVARGVYTAIDYSPGDSIADPKLNCYAAACTPAQVAEWDRAEWLLRVQDTLPRGRARVCQDSAPHDGSKLVWTCDGKGGIVVKLGWQARSADGSLERSGSDGANVGQPRLVLGL